jgi:hypothetical protein
MTVEAGSNRQERYTESIIKSKTDRMKLEALHKAFPNHTDIRIIDAIQAQFNLLNHRINNLEALLIKIQTNLEKN